MADVGEELAFQVIEFLGPRVQVGQFGVGFLEFSACLRHFVGAGEDFLLHLLGGGAQRGRLLLLRRVGCLQADELGDVLHAVNDIAQLAGRIQHR